MVSDPPERARPVEELEREAWLDRHGLDWALLRPDRYVFACGGDDQLPAALQELRAVVGAGLRTEPEETMRPPVRGRESFSTTTKGH